MKSAIPSRSLSMPAIKEMVIRRKLRNKNQTIDFSGPLLSVSPLTEISEIFSTGGPISGPYLWVALILWILVLRLFPAIWHDGEPINYELQKRLNQEERTGSGCFYFTNSGKIWFPLIVVVSRRFGSRVVVKSANITNFYTFCSDDIPTNLPEELLTNRSSTKK